MECHYCDAGADIIVEKDAVLVGVCETHFREQMELLAETDWIDEIEDQLSVDRTE